MFFKNEKDDPTHSAQDENLIPLLPLRDIIIFPHMVVPLFVGRKEINQRAGVGDGRRQECPAFSPA